MKNGQKNNWSKILFCGLSLLLMSVPAMSDEIIDDSSIVETNNSTFIEDENTFVTDGDEFTYDEVYDLEAEDTYYLYEDFLQADGTAESAIESLPSEILDRITFQYSVWEGDAYSFLAKPHYAFAIYANAEVEYIKWSEGETIGDVITPSYTLRNGEKIYLTITDGTQLFSVRSVLPAGLYTMQVVDVNGTVYASEQITIYDNLEVIDLHFGEEIEFAVTGENSVFRLNIQNVEAGETCFPLQLTSVSGSYLLQCLWDNGEVILFSTSDQLYIESGHIEKTVFRTAEEGTCYFIVTPTEETAITGKLRIQNAKELKTIDSIVLPAQLYYEDFICNDDYSLGSEFKVEVTYVDGSNEIIDGWRKRSDSDYYYVPLASGKYLYLYLINAEDQKVSFPTVLKSSTGGNYKWRLEQGDGTEGGVTVLKEQEVQIGWQTDVNVLVDEMIVNNHQSEELYLVSFEIARDDMFLRVMENTEAEDKAAITGWLYNAQEDFLDLEEKFTLWNEDVRNTPLKQGTYYLLLKGKEAGSISLELSAEKKISSLLIENSIPEEILLENLLADMENYLPDKTIRVTITYGDNTTELIDKWTRIQNDYIAETKYGKELILSLVNSDTGEKTGWSKKYVPKEGNYYWTVLSEECVAVSNNNTVLPSNMNHIQHSSFITPEDGSCYAFSVDSYSVYQFEINTDQNNNSDINLYSIEGSAFTLIDNWTPVNREIHSVYLASGEYCLVFGEIEKDLSGTIQVNKRLEVSTVILDGLLNTVFSDVVSDDEEQETEGKISLEGLYATVVYEDESEEKIDLSNPGKVYTLKNGQSILAVAVKLDEEGNPILSDETGKTRSYYYLDRPLASGTYAIVSLVDDDIRADYSISVEVETQDNYSLPEDAGFLRLNKTVYSSVTEEEAIKYYRVNVDHTGTYKVFSASEDQDTVCYLYEVDRYAGFMTLIGEDDDGGDNYNFELVYELDRNKDYILGVKLYYEDESAVIPIGFVEKTLTIIDGNDKSYYYNSDELEDGITLSVTAESTINETIQYQWFQYDNDLEEYYLLKDHTDSSLILTEPKSTFYECTVNDGNETITVTYRIEIDNGLYVSVQNVQASEDHIARIAPDVFVQRGDVFYEWFELRYDEDDVLVSIPLQETESVLEVYGEEGTRDFKVKVTDSFGNSETEWATAHFCTDNEWHETWLYDEPTCSEEGSHEVECSNCGFSMQEELPALGHSWNKVYTVDREPSYTQTGQKSIHCSVCGEIKPGSILSIPVLVEPNADYRKVDAALKKIPSDLRLYTDLTAQKVNTARSTVKWGLKISQQAQVDKMAADIENAVKGLIYKPADYSKVDAALRKIPSNLSGYTDATVKKVTDAKSAVKRGYNITQQKQVDAMAIAIENAVTSLAKKPVAPAKVQLIAAYNGAKGVGVKWIKLTGATEYTIWQKYNGVWRSIKTVKPNDSSLQDSGNTLMYTDQTVRTGYGKGYIYSVSARIGNTVVDYDKAGVAIYRLNPPTLTKGTNPKTGTVTISWKSVFGKTETNGAYDLQYATEADAKAGRFTSVKKLPGYAHNVTSTTVTGLKKGTKYVFRIRCSKTNKDRGTFYSEYSPWMSVVVKK